MKNDDKSREKNRKQRKIARAAYRTRTKARTREQSVEEEKYQRRGENVAGDGGPSPEVTGFFRIADRYFGHAVWWGEGREGTWSLNGVDPNPGKKGA
ncbi:hypothetical protein H6P81_001717 [Aristolochia fimbriata]|uniref:BZIP domain-containing protein n=1 Tax=Aristolochia fimbriata TaxID=158543 RepID=A0AAV7F9C6_ARIFI|nr:hypothetical protein H6P81_001717 [Aristolochia fimbriata]